jgi:hypothetical protein
MMYSRPSRWQLAKELGGRYPGDSYCPGREEDDTVTNAYRQLPHSHADRDVDMGMGMGIHLLSPFSQLTVPWCQQLSIDLSIHCRFSVRFTDTKAQRSAGLTRMESQTERTHHEIREAAASLQKRSRPSVSQAGSQAGRQEPWDLSSHHTTAGNLLPYVCNGLRRPG